jgi:lysophospholipase L1-like esterase
MRDFPLHTALTIALVAAAALVGQALSPAKAPTVVAPAPVAPPPTIAIRPSPLLDDESGVLDRFYRALQHTEAKEAGSVTRIVHYGDSPTTADLITGDVRSILQSTFGDAGHGFILPAKPWAWYQHTGAQVEGKGWQILAASHFEARDGRFGLGGVTFTGTGASSKFGFQGEGYTKFELWYLQQPGGGTVSLSTGTAELGHVETAGEAGLPGFAVFESKEPVNRLDLRVVPDRPQAKARIFGITAERDLPGIVYDSLGLNGASITVLSRMFNEAHWAAELQHRNPNLVVINYGTNEADFPAFIEKQYEKELREAIRRAQAALPAASILVMSPMDRGYKDKAGDIATMPTIPQIVEIQRRVARETGCGFFDTYRAMGGEGTMARWYAAKPRLVSADFIHPYPAAGKQIAVTFTREIAGGLNRFKLRQGSAVR